MAGFLIIGLLWMYEAVQERIASPQQNNGT
ncbi:hypothetical protein BOMU111920_17900 [Bordetella muralis]